MMIWVYCTTYINKVGASRFFFLKFFISVLGERGGVVVEHQTPNREVLGSIPTGGTMLCL